MAPREGYTEKKDYDTSKTNTASASFEMASLAMAEANKDMLYSEISKASYADKEGDMPGVQPFHAVFDREVIRVADFINSQQHNLEFSAKSLLTSAEVASETKNPEGGIDLVHSLALKMDDLVENIIELQTCMAQNRSILRVVAEKADKELKTSCTSLLERRLKTNLNSVLVCVASDIYAAIRTAEKNITNNGAGQDGGMWEAPSSFQRATTKYWVRDDNLTKLLLSCAAEAPLLVYGKKGSLTPKENRHSGQSEGDKLWESLAMPITSVYFDSADMGLYKKRIARIEGAQLLRARWYGNKMPTGDGIIFLELKTHHEKWVSNKSVKERAAVKESDMQEFLRPIRWTIHDAQAMIARASPTLGSDELAKSANLLFRMHRLVVKHKLQSCVRSIYMRAAFQSPKSNDLRLTLDRNVTLVDETGRQPGSSWCLPDEALGHSTKEAQVPFNVFEVKLSGEDGMPPGLATLISEGVMEEAPKFSKFLTGAAAFNKVSTLPYWAKHPLFAPMFGLTTPQPPNGSVQDYSSPVDPCDMCYHLMAPFSSSDNNEQSTSPSPPRQTSALANTLRGAWPWKGAVGAKDVNIAEKKPVRVEPKSFFANERTFISWISAGLLLLTVSTIMMGNGDYFRTSALISGAALCLVFYATFVYFRRIKLLQSGKGYGYVDHVGPVILAAGVGIGVSIVFADILRASEFVTWETNADANGRRGLSMFDNNTPHGHVRRLVDERISMSLPTMYEDQAGKCFQHSMTGVNSLKYQPSDVILDERTNALLVASTHEIVSHPLMMMLEGEAAAASHLVKLPNTELTGLTAVGDRVFALSGGPYRTELIELARTSDQGMEVQARWTVSDSVSQQAAEAGLTFVPDQTTTTNLNSVDPQGQLYLTLNGSIHSYQIPSPQDESLTLVDSLNMKLISQGLGSGEHGSNKMISAMHYFEGVTYLLHSDRQVIHAWDLETGVFLAEIPLPHAENNDDNNNAWRGMTLERRRVVVSTSSSEDGGSSSLRGASSNDDDSSSTVLLLHLTLDGAPRPQIWTFAMEEEDEGSLVFPECAAAVTKSRPSAIH